MSDRKEDHRGLVLMDKFFDVLVWVSRLATGVTLVLMTVLMGYQVYGRYVLNDTPTWVDPLSMILIMVIAFVGAAVGWRENTHLSVVIFRSIVPARIRLVMVFCTDLLMGGFGAVLLYYGTTLTMFRWGNAIPLIGWPEGLRTLPLAICGALVLVFSIGHMAKMFLGRDSRTDSIE